MADLPEVILFEILLRLPVKSLCRFRCVSQTWRSLISGSYFVNLHLKHALLNPNRDNHKIICAIDSKLKSFDYNASPFGDESYFTNLDFLVDVVYLVLGSCNGLICVAGIGSSKLFIWNPATRAHKEIPDFFISRDNSYVFKHGFGYDESSDDYKVYFAYRDRVIGYTSVSIFSLKTGTWRFLQETDNSIVAETTGVFLNGSLHWIDLDGKIIVFDLATESFKGMPLPDVVGKTFQCLGVLRGRLACLMEGLDIDDDSIWVMNEYGVKESWTKMTKVPYYVRFDPFKYAPLCVTQHGEILFSFDRKVLLKFDPKSETISPRRICIDHVGVMCYVESLIPINLRRNREAAEN